MDILFIMVRNNDPKSLVGGPVCFLQLWLNSLFNDRIVYSPLEDLQVLTYGTKLCYLIYRAVEVWMMRKISSISLSFSMT